MSPFNVVNGLVVCSISTIVMQLDSTRSIYGTKRGWQLTAHGSGAGCAGAGAVVTQRNRGTGSPQRPGMPAWVQGRQLRQRFGRDDQWAVQGRADPSSRTVKDEGSRGAGNPGMGLVV